MGLRPVNTPARVLVTGAAGFFGRHLCSYLVDGPPRATVSATDIAPAVELPCDDFIVADLSQQSAADELVQRAAPEFIVHLAGIFGTGATVDTYRANVLATVGLLEAARRHAPRSAIIVAGSAAEYGRCAAEHLPVAEDCPCEPLTAYGHSKLLATQTALYYHRVYGLASMVIRPFQLIGRGVTERLAPGAFAARLKQALAAGSPTIKAGNLDSQRDFLDVQDAVAALWAVCQRPAPGQIFNLCSGRPTRMRDLLDLMIAATGAAVRVETDPSLLRGTADVSVVYGSFEKLRRHCGWQPRRSLEQSVRTML
jgi:nucleoside-diphosphate-sugar epimerase